MLKAKQLLVFNASRHLYNNIICEMNWFAKYLAIILSENLFYVFAGHEIPVLFLFLLFFTSPSISHWHKFSKYFATKQENFTLRRHWHCLDNKGIVLKSLDVNGFVRIYGLLYWLLMDYDKLIQPYINKSFKLVVSLTWSWWQVNIMTEKASMS